MAVGIKESPRRQKAVMTQVFWGYLNKIIIIIRSILLIPFYLHFLGDRLYGFWLASGSILAWLSFLDMGIAGMLIQRISSAYGKKDYSLAGSYFLNGLYVFLVIGVIFMIIGVGISFFIPKVLRVPENNADLLRSCFQLVSVAAALNIVCNVLNGFSQALQRPFYPGLFRVVFNVSSFVGIIVMLNAGFGLWAIAVGALLYSVPLTVMNLVNSLLLFRSLGSRFSIDTRILREFFALSPALFFGRLGNSVVERAEPTIITIMLCPELTTVFVITKRAGEMIRMMLQVVIASFAPSFSHLYAEGNDCKASDILSKIISFSFCAGLVGFSAYAAGNRSFVGLWVGADKFAGQGLTALIGVGLFIAFLQSFMSRTLINMGEIGRTSILIFAESILRIFLMITFLKIIGLKGLPVAMVISCGAFYIIFCTRVSKRLSFDIYKNSISKKFLLLAVVIFTLCTWLGIKVINESWLTLVVFMFILTAVMTIAVFGTNPLTRKLLVEKAGCLVRTKNK